MRKVQVGKLLEKWKPKSKKPVGREDEGGSALPAAALCEGFAPGIKALLVDDSKVNQEVTKAVLEPLMMQIDVADNGEKALQMIQQKRYDVVFMDVYMPGMDGVEATKQIRALPDAYYKSVPILALTAEAGERERVIGAGMNDMINKPVRLQIFCEKLMLYLPAELVKKQDT